MYSLSKDSPHCKDVAPGFDMIFVFIFIAMKFQSTKPRFNQNLMSTIILVKFTCYNSHKLRSMCTYACGLES